MSKHTPGPWTTKSELSIEGHVWGGLDGRLIANCRGYSTNTEDVVDEQNANARLIAAAPDLLEALVEAVAFEMHNPDAPKRLEPRWLVSARAAVDKATGTD